MNKFIAIATLLLFAGTLTATAQNSPYMMSKTFKFTFSEEVMIQVGAAKENKSTKEWEKGGTVGKHPIDPALFEEIKKATSSQFLIEIEKKKVGTLHGMKVTDLETGKVIKGIYDEKDNKFTFGAAKTTHQNGGSKTDIGVIAGQFNDDLTSIQNGEFGIGFIAGKAPAVISARAVFYFSGQAVK